MEEVKVGMLFCFVFSLLNAAFMVGNIIYGNTGLAALNGVALGIGGASVVCLVVLRD